MRRLGKLSQAADMFKDLDAALRSLDTVVAKLAQPSTMKLEPAAVIESDRRSHDGCHTRCPREDGCSREDSLDLSFSSDSSLGYRSASDASDDISLGGSGYCCDTASVSPKAHHGGFSDSRCSDKSPVYNIGRKTDTSVGLCPASAGVENACSEFESTTDGNPTSSNARPPGHGSTKLPSASRPSFIPRAATGASTVSEDDFSKAFQGTQKANILTKADLEERLEAVESTLSDSVQPWEQRLDALKAVRQVALAAGPESSNLVSHLRTLAVGLQLCLGDPRSQVVREACISVGFLAQMLGVKLEPLAEMVFHQLMNLVLSSASVMATAGSVALRFLTRHVHSQRLLLLLVQQLACKASQIRRQVSQLLELVVHNWPDNVVEKHEERLQAALQTSVNDADAHVRETSSRILSKLSAHQAERATTSAMHHCHLSKLQKEKHACDSGGSSRDDGSLKERLKTHCLAGRNTPQKLYASEPVRCSDVGHVLKVGTFGGQHLDIEGKSTLSPGPMQSPPIASLQPAKAPATASTAQQPSRKGLLRSADLVSRCQRSPATVAQLELSRAEPRGQLQQNDRVESYKAQTAPQQRGPVSGAPAVPAGRGSTRERHHSSQSHDSAELGNCTTRSDSAKDSGAATGDECEDAGSDVSSVCSEALDIGQAAFVHATEDIGEVLANISSPMWAARKRGLLQLQRFVVDQRSLSANELKKVTDVFTRMFYDPNLKVYSTFLDSLVDVVRVHPHDLSGWLPTLLARLLLVKRGEGKRLSSVASKAQRSLRAVRASFDNAAQLQAVSVLLTDEGHAMGIEEKLRTLQYLLALVRQMDSFEFTGRQDTDRLLRLLEQLVIATCEVKSAAVRKVAHEVLSALFELNAPEFSYVLGRSPGPVQVAVRRALQAHMQNVYAAATTAAASTDSYVGPSTVAPDSCWTTEKTPEGSKVKVRDGQDSGGQAAPTSSLLSPASKSESSSVSYGGGRYQQTANQTSKGCDRKLTCLSNDSGIGIPGSLTDLDCISPLSGEAGEQQASMAVTSDSFEEPATANNPHQESGGPSPAGQPKKLFPPRNQSLLPDVVNQIAPVCTNKTGSASEIPPKADCLEHLQQFSDKGCTDQGGNPSAASNDLLRIVQGTSELDFHELCAISDYIKTNGLGILEHQLEPLVWKTLSACQNSSLEGISAAEELLDVVSSAANPEQLLRIVCKASLSEDDSVSLAAIRMEAKVIRLLSEDIVDRHISILLPGLLQGFNHSESAIRKASVLALVELHAHTGDVLTERHLAASLNSSQIKLLNVYIQRAAIGTKEVRGTVV